MAHLAEERKNFENIYAPTREKLDHGTQHTTDVRTWSLFLFNIGRLYVTYTSAPDNITLCTQLQQ